MPKAPIADEGLTCPLHKKDVSTVCHKCPWYIQVRGENPQTGQEIDNWSCSIGLLPMLLINTAKEVRQGAAATESFRNEWAKSANNPIQFLEGIVHAATKPRLGDGR